MRLFKTICGKTDFWTLINFIGNIVIKPVINTISSGITYDTMVVVVVGTSNDNQSWYELSPTALLVGASVALLAAIGESASHSSLNSNHQHNHDSHNENRGAIELSNLSSTQVPLLNFEDNAQQTSESKTNETSCSSVVKYIFLFGDFLAHSMDTNSPLTLVFHLLKPNSFDKYPYANQIVQFCIILWSSLSSVAEARTCKYNMDKHLNSSQSLNSQSSEMTTTRKHSDIWVIFSCLTDTTCIFLNILVYLGSLIDNISKDVEITDLSLPALICGIAVGIFIAIPSGHCHFMVNSNHQSKSTMLNSSNNQEIVLNKWQILWRKFQSKADQTSHITDRASQISSVVRILAPGELSIAKNLTLIFASGLTASVVSYADHRTCDQNALKYYGR